MLYNRIDQTYSRILAAAWCIVMRLRWRKGKSELNVSTPCLPWIAKTSKASRSDHFFWCLVILSKFCRGPFWFGTVIWNHLAPKPCMWDYVRKGKPIAANLYLKNVYERHEKRSHSRTKPALVFNRKSADQVLARQGKAILNWFATDCWSKKTWSAEPWNLHQFPDNFCISMIAGLPSFVIQGTVSTWWTCLEVKYEASNGPYWFNITIADFEVSEEKPSCESSRQEAWWMAP